MTTHGSATNLQAVYPSSGLNARADDQSTPGLTRSGRSEEHTSELQSQSNLVCRLLLEKKKKHILVTTLVDRSSRYAYHSRQLDHCLGLPCRVDTYYSVLDSVVGCSYPSYTLCTVCRQF